ncbi:Peroxidase 48 [Artemisia annua]|uniref:Peroxidase n=1 Tax=Artemisia annua TaxID=35608 RepID=A0A2U1NW97_ARTAN|nr:Peroxidase 48 [Artemisia annua]
MRTSSKVEVFGRAISTEGFSIQDKVVDIVHDNAWRWPSTWLVRFPTLSIVQVPILHNNQEDVLYLKSHDGLFKDFIVRDIWHAIHDRETEVSWHSFVWSTYGFPRHSIHVWLLMRKRLKTQDRLRQWDVGSDVDLNQLRCTLYLGAIAGCDASVLLDQTEVMGTEKTTLPNESLKGFEHIDLIKSELENVCPGVVSCADLLVMAARESVVLVGGPFYPLHTGRKDSVQSYPVDSFQLPSPLDTHHQSIARFTARNFTEKETVTLLGAHSTGKIHCKFFEKRLYNFDGTNQPDPSMDPEFVELLRTILLQGRGILFVDQQMTAGENTSNWVRQYASDVSMFHKDFAQVMMKLSNYQVLTGSQGDVRQNCREVTTSLWQVVP